MAHDDGNGGALHESARSRVASAVLVVPIRSFTNAKARLASVLDATQRAALARDLADRVVDAAGELPIGVVTNDAAVARWARSRNATIIEDTGSLDTAAYAGLEWAHSVGADRVIVAHGDVPFAHGLERLAAHGAAPVAVLVADHRLDGTPILSIPTTTTFRFAYGPGSFARHRDLAVAAGLRVEEFDDPDLSFDVDDPSDLQRFTRLVATRVRRGA